MSEQTAVQTFEEAYQQLSQIVDQLERCALSLDESLARHERGRLLLAFRRHKLESV
jgi:exodeoxyribonuclease VII small subunit